MATRCARGFDFDTSNKYFKRIGFKRIKEMLKAVVSVVVFSKLLSFFAVGNANY